MAQSGDPTRQPAPALTRAARRYLGRRRVTRTRSKTVSSPVRLKRSVGPARTSCSSAPPEFEGKQFRGRHAQLVTSDLAAGAARITDFDAIVIPGGYAPDKMRLRHSMVDLVRNAMAAGKPVAAICHGPQLLISANALRDRTVTCWPSIAVDVKNAGGLYVDQPVAQDGNLITSRKPDDVPLFSEALIRALSRLEAASL